MEPMNSPPLRSDFPARAARVDDDPPREARASPRVVGLDESSLGVVRQPRVDGRESGKVVEVRDSAKLPSRFSAYFGAISSKYGALRASGVLRCFPAGVPAAKVWAWASKLAALGAHFSGKTARGTCDFSNGVAMAISPICSGSARRLGA